MCANNKNNVEQSTEKEAAPAPGYRCGYCGSTNFLVDPEELYGPGAQGWPCCPDCGGV